MSLVDFFKKKGSNYDAAAEFFVTPELIIQEGKQHDGYSLAIDTGYEDLLRTVKRVVLEGDEISIKTETSYVSFNELFSAMGINEIPKVVQEQTKSLSKPITTAKTSSQDDKVKSASKDQSQPVPGSILAEDLPEKIRLKQSSVIEQGVYYKPIKVVSTLEVQDAGVQKDTDIAVSYYLAPISFIDGEFKELSPAQCSHIVETSWSDAYIEAMNGDSQNDVPTHAAPRNDKQAAVKSAMKAPVIVALSLTAAFASLYGYNQYQQNTNPLSIAASNGNVGTYMTAKGTNTDEYTQRQLEATKAALGSMGIDVSADADIGCLIE